ncbi:ribosomal protection-like ABC-F family protein [Marinilactibacillus kalidii]|uniref:ribosomal protection-like ABC-F family protein n=1 Tax=Marinilactibacillus kalidii TaxID=2820274 RepID=UPI001ABE8C22|nr:ABC-F type ribosomal protection protein [Marinilactibacillus kalidii]
MAWIEINQLTYSIKDRNLFSIEHLKVEPGDKIGLVGKNGSGKTTLLNILKGTIQPDTGTIKRLQTITMIPQLKETIDTKSGGEVTANAIINSLNEKAGILFADEPTTHLDVEHVEWLEKEIIAYKGAHIIISHDRDFLDHTCNKVWELSNEEIKEFTGNYSAYEEIKQKEHKRQQNAYDSYRKKEKQLQEAKEKKEQQADRATKKPSNVSGSEARIAGSVPYFQKKAKKLHKTASSIDKRIDQLEAVDRPEAIEPVKMKLTNAKGFINKKIIRANDFGIRFGQKILFKPTSFYIKGGEKVAIVGANGSGKTTLLKHILAESEGITISPAMKVGYFAQDLSVLKEDQTILQNVQEGSKQSETLIRIVLAQLLFKKDDVYKPIHVLSGGERVKVALAKLLVGDFNTLVLDEPTNFLDTQAIEALESLLREYEGSLLVVSHDRRFMNKVANRLMIIEENQLKTFEGRYEDYKNTTSRQSPDKQEEELMRLENEIVKVLSQLSIEPSAELEQTFQELLKAKKQLMN